MKNYRKEYEQSKPVCPECGAIVTYIVGFKDGDNMASCNCGNMWTTHISTYTQYLESELEKRDDKLGKIKSLSRTLLEHLQKIINQSSLVIPEPETRAWLKLDILIESFAKAIKGE